MDAIKTTKELFEILVPLTTLVLAFLGLTTWRKKLWGENKFSLATSTIKELYLVKEEIKNFRVGFYSGGEIYSAIREYRKEHPEEKIDDSKDSEYAEMRRWNLVVDQYQKYSTELTKLKVILNDYEIDSIQGKRMEDFLKEINLKRMHRQLNSQSLGQLQHMEEGQRKDFLNQQQEIFRVLVRSGPDDGLEDSIEKYFKGFNQRVRKYIKN